ncbi:MULTISPECIES: TetR/AcrR family transcriptional regulator [unclassified Pseudonocardia]|uniref:TetR/AcrR family transcriptional regulator n=1 Tax=unclassified Pseudonocardia TaxID=2619320 RepID=UPI0001FFE7AE|nr:TetR/AcrR family transcriptional regulator [Pseudonocardia sp. Ae707_Ps1]OLM09246.1 Transcriptional regulator, TetR family [Pseudonocardia sp. Ae707_Ps1]
MPPRRRSTANGRRNREPEIIAAAIQVFSANGYGASSLQDVADIVGVLKGSLYHYIDSKEDLLYQILDASHRQAADLMERSLASSEDPLEQLRHYLYTLTMWNLANIDRVSIYFNEGRWLTGDRLAKVQQQGREFQAFIRSLIEKAQAADQVRRGVDPRLQTQLILGSLNYMSSWYRADGLFGPEEVATALTDTALVSLVHDGSEIGQAKSH